MAEAEVVEEVLEAEEELEPEEIVDPEQEETVVEEPEPAAEKKHGRANEAIRVARERAQAAERDAQSARDESARMRAESHAREEAVRASRQAEEERDLPYDEKLYRHTQRHQQDIERRLQHMQFQSDDRADRMGFESKKSSDPVYAKYSDEVEKVLHAARQAGSNPPREGIIANLVWRDRNSSKSKAATSKAKDEAGKRVSSARGAVQSRGGSRGDVVGGKQRTKTLEDKIGIDTRI